MIKNKLLSVVVLLGLVLGQSPLRAETENRPASIYQAPLQWKSQDDKPVRLSDFKGRKVVMSMIYASCQTACPLILKKVKAVKAELDRRKQSAEFVLVTFDSEGDVPEKLRHFRHHNDVASPAWTFLVGSEKDTRTLSMLLGIKYSKNPGNGQIMHDNKIVLLDEQGAIVRTLEGLNTDLGDLY